jgi:DNA gyrase/topoisomerase IV subunit B
MTIDQTGTGYTGAKIQVLKGLEAVRHRPAYC